MVYHDLKCWPEPFGAILDGRKTYEIRSMRDRDFHVGDTLRLCEWVPDLTTYDPVDFSAKTKGKYTNREIHAEITYITQPGTWGLPGDICVLGIKVTGAKSQGST